MSMDLEVMEKLQVICHGIPDMRPLQEGDICNVDVTVYHRWSNRSIEEISSGNDKLFRGYHGDLNETIFVGEVSQKAKDLVVNTWECLEKAIAECVKPGVKYRDVGSVIQKHATTGGYSVVRSYCGHGIHKWALGLISHLICCPGCSTAPQMCLTMQRTRLWEWWSLGTASPSSRWSLRGWVPRLCSSAHSLPVKGLGRPDLAWQLDLGDSGWKTLRPVRADHGCHRHRGWGQMLTPISHVLNWLEQPFQVLTARPGKRHVPYFMDSWSELWFITPASPLVDCSQNCRPLVTYSLRAGNPYSTLPANNVNKIFKIRTLIYQIQ